MQGIAASSDCPPRATADRVPPPSKVVDDSVIRAALAVHLGRKFGGEVAIADFARKSSGFSWITYSFVARRPSKPDRKLILRVGPPNGLFAPYSVLPQVNALQSLAGTAVPAPALVSFDEEGAEIGFPFFVCEHVEGEVPAPWASSALGEDHRRNIAGQFVAILGELHKFDWRGTSLAASDIAGEARGEVRAIRVWRASLARPTARYTGNSRISATLMKISPGP